MTSPHLTKTKFCTGLQCHKLLYWTVHDSKAPELVPGPAKRYIFAVGHRVGELYRGQKKQRDQLAAAGVATIDRIPSAFPLNEIQQRQVRAVCDDAPVVTDALPGQLALPRYPIRYLDFETFSPAIPRYPGTGPFHQTAVQFSCHTRYEDESLDLDHREFLSEADDPRPEIAGHLLDALGTSGTIVVYSGFEATCIRDLAAAVPERRDELTQLLPRLWDLCKVIREGIYHPDFHGSFSIKSTYPALCPGAGYADLEVASGYDAMAQYDKLLQEKTPRWLKGKIRAELLAYCERDTRAMVEIHKVLEGLATGAGH